METYELFNCTLSFFYLFDLDERKAEIVATTRLFEETRELLEQMDLEIQEMPADIKPKYTTRLQCYGQELARLGQEFVCAYVVFSFNMLQISLITQQRLIWLNVSFVLKLSIDYSSFRDV